MPIPDTLAAAFAELGITAPCVEHPPLRTVADAHAHWDGLPGMAVKNLFIRDSGRQYWLVTLPADRSVDTKLLAALIGAKRISFGPADDLRTILGVEPGSVTPLAAMNDTQNQVRVVLHAAMTEAEAVLVHPLVNTATLIMKPGDLLRFMDAHGGAMLVDLTAAFREGE